MLESRPSGDSLLDDEAKRRALTRMAERIARESETLPYRWGYVQGIFLIPWSLLCISMAISDFLNPPSYPWYLLSVALLMGVLGLPLAYGLLRKKVFALVLVYVMFGLTLLLAAVKLPTVIQHFHSQKLSASFDGELLLMWLLSIVYYKRRKAQFH